MGGNGRVWGACAGVVVGRRTHARPGTQARARGRKCRDCVGQLWGNVCKEGRLVAVGQGTHPRTLWGESVGRLRARCGEHGRRLGFTLKPWPW